MLIKKCYHEKFPKIILISFITSALTLPYLWFVLPAIISNRGVYMIGGELLVILVETIIYNQLFKLKLSEALVVSLVANTASILLGRVF